MVYLRSFLSLCLDFQNSPIYVIALECLNRKYLAPKKREWKNEGEKMCWYFQFPGSHSAREGGACSNWIRVAQMAAHCVFSSLLSGWSTDPQHLESGVLPRLPKIACKVLQGHTNGCLLQGKGIRDGSCYSAKD